LELIDYEFDEALFRLVHIKAHQLVGTLGLSWNDVEDVANELYLNWLQHSTRFKPQRSSQRTFQNRVINNAVVDLLRKRKTQLRGYGYVMVPLEHIDYGLIGSRDAESDSGDQRLDILKTVHRMPPELIPIALTLMQADSHTDTANRLGISRPALYRSIVRIRDFFDQAGFRPSSRGATRQTKGRSHNRLRRRKRTPN